MFGGGKGKTAFKGEYLGGHSAHAKKQKVCLEVDPDCLKIKELGLSIPYNEIQKIENTTKEKLSAGRVVMLGVVGALWKKEERLLALTMTDHVLKQDQTLVFKMDKLQEAQTAIYNRVAEARKQM
jgi:hypothetical protein